VAFAGVRVGSIICNKWRIDARLARGGVATVYAATHRKNGARVALKILHPEHANAPEVTRRFAQEGYLANKVDHPGVVRVLDDDVTEDGRPFIVMELLTGELLEEKRLRNGGRLSVLMTLNIGIQILDILASAHEKDIVHRDVKPENVFLTHEGTVKMLDFGIARTKLSLGTATGLLVGTAEFMAPEQALGRSKDISEQTDIWGVGATLFVLRAGEPVHEGASLGEILKSVSSTPARSLATASADSPASLVAVIDRALQFDKERRWPNAREMRAALVRCLKELQESELDDTTHATDLTRANNGELEQQTQRVAVSEVPSSPAPARHLPRAQQPTLPEVQQATMERDVTNDPDILTAPRVKRPALLFASSPGDLRTEELPTSVKKIRGNEGPPQGADAKRDEQPRSVPVSLPNLHLYENGDATIQESRPPIALPDQAGTDVQPHNESDAPSVDDPFQSRWSKLLAFRGTRANASRWIAIGAVLVLAACGATCAAIDAATVPAPSASPAKP
jgi:serine/threonine protein kinase